MVRLDGVEVVEDGASSFPGDDEFTLEGELPYLVEADAEDLGRFRGLQPSIGELLQPPTATLCARALCEHVADAQGDCLRCSGAQTYLTGPGN